MNQIHIPKMTRYISHLATICNLVSFRTLKAYNGSITVERDVSLLQKMKRRSVEMDRVRAFYGSIRNLPNLKSIAVFDTVLPATYIEKFVRLPGVENLVFIACETEAEPGKFKAFSQIELKVHRTDATEPRIAPKLR